MTCFPADVGREFEVKPQRLDLRYHIVWQGRWHVGSGYQSAAADRLQRRWKSRGCDDAPFVPGSQIKGVLRHHCERLANALELETVDPHDVGDRSLVAHFRPLAKSGLLIDRLFGSRYQGECLFVANALPTTSTHASPTTVAARTAIDRVTGTVREQHLFTTELVEKGIDLHGEIRARHPGGVLTQDDEGFPYEYALLVAGVLSLEALGGDRSVGMGRCEVGIEPDSLRWNGKTVSLDDALRSFDEHDWADMLHLLRETSEDQTP